MSSDPTETVETIKKTLNVCPICSGVPVIEETVDFVGDGVTPLYRIFCEHKKESPRLWAPLKTIYSDDLQLLSSKWNAI